MLDTQAQIRIALIDNHPVTLYGMRAIFATDPCLDVVYSADSLTDLAVWCPGVDVVILELYLTGNRLSAAEITSVARHCPVLVVSASSRRDDVLAAIQSGASGYLTKNSNCEAYLAAVRTVVANGIHVSSQLTDHSDNEAGEGCELGTNAALAPREREALAYIAQGFTQAQAATRMGVSPATVDTYVRRIRKKLGPGNKAELTRRAIELGEVRHQRERYELAA
jgi:DNA-binding NarL/FixJ family response regulator